MATLTQPKRLTDVFFFEHTQEFARFCREERTILAGSGSDRVLTVGMILAKVSKGSATATAKAGNTGNGTVGTITVGAAARDGKYKATFIEPGTNLGDYVVEDPDGVNVGSGRVGTAFAGGGLGFTIADGSTDFVAGDQFDIDVAAGSGKYKQIDFAGTDGSEDAAGVLVTDRVVAPNGVDAKAVVVEPGPGVSVILKKGGIVWPAGASDPQKAAALAQLAAGGIKARQEV